MNLIDKVELLEKTLAKVYIELAIYDGIEEFDKIINIIRQTLREIDQ